MSESKTLKIGIYGEYATMKTWQISRLIKLVGADKVKILSADKGLNTIASYITDDMIIVVNNYDDVRQSYKTLAAWAAPDRWLCIDGGSQIAQWNCNIQLAGADRYYIAKVLGQEIRDELKPFGRFMSKEGNVDTMRIYNKVGIDAENILATWKALPCNLYVNYLADMTGTDGYKKMPPWGPDVPGKVGLAAVMSTFDYVLRVAYNDEEKITAYFNPAKSMQYMSRTREDRSVVTLPEGMTIPNFDLAEFVKLVGPKEVSSGGDSGTEGGTERGVEEDRPTGGENTTSRKDHQKS